MTTTTTATDTAQTEGTAIAGFITSILFWPAGLVLNPMALSAISKNGKQGTGLAIAGLSISVAGMLITAALVAGAVFVAANLGQFAQRPLAAAAGSPVTISEDVTFTADRMNCSIAEGSHVSCSAEVTVSNDSTLPVTLSPEVIVAATGTTMRGAATLAMQPAALTVQPGESAEAVVTVTASDREWYERGVGLDDVIDFYLR